MGTSMQTIWRIQDANGRGPFRPGFSDRWRDAFGQDFPAIIPSQDALRPGYRYAVGCRSLEELRQWFSRAERRRLTRLGFEIVSVQPDVIVAEYENQVLFGLRSEAA